MKVFTPHSIKQQQTILSNDPITMLCCGIQFGKTTAGSIWLKRQMHTYTDPGDNFIITSPNYKILQQSTLPAFLKYMEGYGTYNKVDAVFKMDHGGTCYFRTATEPDSIVGITDVRAIWGDEAGKYSLYFWENMQARASFKACPILLTTSPYTTNWVYKELIKPVKNGQRDDVKLIQAASNENPFFPAGEFDRKKRTMDPRRFAALYLGEFSRMHGLVYDCFTIEANGVLSTEVELPVGTKYFAGIDWGYTDPFVMKIRAVTPNGYHFAISEIYKTGLSVTEMITAAKQKKQIFNLAMCFADPSRPEYIEEFNRNGIPCVAADNSIRIGIDTHYELIKSGKYKIFTDKNPHTLDEYESYHYPEPEELDTDQDSKEQLPVGQNDHCIEENCLIATDRGSIKIKNIKEGDLVLTRKGFKKVLLVHDNGIKDVYKFGSLICTEDHLIYTDEGYTRLDSIGYERSIVCLKDWFSMAMLIADILNRSIRIFGSIFPGLKGIQKRIYTETFGSTKTGEYQMDSISITKMETTSTIPLKIWNVFQQANIYLNTALSGMKIIKSDLLNTLKTFVILPRLGINLLKVESGIAIMANSQREKREDDVTFAERAIGISQVSQSSATSTAEPKPYEIVGKARVFDLTVEDAHEFFANGILVHNCLDAERYVTMGTRGMAVQKTVPKVISEQDPLKKNVDHEERIRILKKGKRNMPNSETWS